MNDNQCPDPGAWKTFLDGELLDEASADLTAHLEDCEACQQTLERLAAGKETWEGTAKQLAEADANAKQLESSGYLRDVLDDLKQGIEIDNRAASITPESLTFLAESEEGDSIGKLGSYEVLEIVGAGGMGIVMRAWDPSLRRIVAIKVLASHLANSAAARRRFVREAQAAAAVSHDHVVAIHAVEADHEPPYLVMQYIEGKTLQQRLDGVGPLHVREVLRIGQQTALGLSAAHQQGIVHRDIKPANILLENGVERVRITDFGLARAIDDASMTQSGVVAGTPLFMAPEQAQGIPLDHRADLFSLGSVLYVMCTGRPPFRSSTMIGVIRRVCDDSPRPIREINPDVPDWLCGIIDRLLAKDPKERYDSAEEVAELLGNCLAHVQQPTTVPIPESAQTVRSAFETSAAESQQTESSRDGNPGQIVQAADSDSSTAQMSDCSQAVASVPVTPRQIRREVFWPTAAMITTGIANLVVATGSVVYLIGRFSSEYIPYLSTRIIGLLPPALIIYGAYRMLRMQSRIWGIVAAMACLLSGPCYSLGWPASVWALAVLMRPHVQREFVRLQKQHRQSRNESIADDELIVDEFRPIATFGQKLARVLLLIGLSLTGAVIPYGGIIAFTFKGHGWNPQRFFMATAGTALVIAAYAGLTLYRYGFESCSAELQQSRRDLVRRKLRAPGLWIGTFGGLLPCLAITLDINATIYNDFLSGSVVPLSLIGTVLLIVGAVMNLNRAQADRYAGRVVDHPAFAVFEWPAPILAILWTAFVAWSDFQGTVGYARFQIDDPNSMVTLTSDDSRQQFAKQGGWRKLRIPEGKYYWTVSDPGILDDHAANGTVDIESPRTSVIDVEIHRGNALERSEGYWRCVSTDSVLNGGGVKDHRWATTPGWIAIDKQFILSWDALGNLIGNWSLKRNADSSPKTFEIVDILTGNLIGEGQWAVSQKQLLLRLYPPRKTTSPYLSSIFSEPTNGDLLEWRFEKLSGPPAWLDPDLAAEAEADKLADDGDRPFGDLTFTDPVVSDRDGRRNFESELDGRWEFETMFQGPAQIFPKGGSGELIFAGDWLITFDTNERIAKSIVTTQTDVSPKRIRIEMRTDEGDPVVLHGVYRVDSPQKHFRNLELYFLEPGLVAFGKNAGPDADPLDKSEVAERVETLLGSLTKECFDDPPGPGRMLWRCRLPSDYQRIVTQAPDIEGLVVETTQASPGSNALVEISLGADDGLKEGHELSIHRTEVRNGEAFGILPLGNIRLKLVTPDRSVGIVTLQHEGAKFKKGDVVTSLPQ